MASSRHSNNRAQPAPSQVRKQIQRKLQEGDTLSNPLACQVCGRDDCQLRSHKAYLAHKRHAAADKSVEKAKEAPDSPRPGFLQTSFSKSYAYTRALPSLGAGRLDGFHDLPVPGGHQLDLHQSVYNLLHSKLGAATAFPLPVGLQVNEIGGSMIIPVMTDTSLCLSAIAAWKAVQYLMGQATAFPHLSYEAQALQSLRKQLLEQGHAAITNEAILAAVLLWASATMFAQTDALRRHSTGVCALIAARGGLKAIARHDSIGQAASVKQLLLWADFLTAQFLGEAVLFNDIEPAEPLPTSLVTLSQAIALPSQWKALLPATLKAAQDLKLLLVSQDTATRVGRLSIAEYKALLALLNRSTIERINLEHRHSKSNSPDECVLVAMNLLRLTVLFHAGPLFTIVVSVISRLRNALKRTTVDSFNSTTSDCIDVYIWACFVGLVNEFDSENRSYFVEMLSIALSVKYEDGRWPANWRTQNLDMLRSALWSDTVLTKLYFDACQMIEAFVMTPDSYLPL